MVHTSSADARGPDIGCADCHGASPTDYTKFADAQNLANTNVCDACHSPGGTFNGIDSQATTTGPSVGAKDNWSMETTSLVYNGAGTALRSGKEKWCVGCHDTSGAIVKGQTASNKGGNNSSYGYFATGHGKTSSFARMSWQDTAASSNSAANRACTRCHDTDAGAGQAHIRLSGSSARLKAGYEDDASNSNCKQCHDPGTDATSTPTWYATYSAYSASAHKGTKCTECHDVHGETGSYTGMTKADKSNLCSLCHSKTSQGGHTPGQSFAVAGKNYSIQCASCHNVHVITGKFSETSTTVTPISRFADNTEPWGDEPIEKMSGLGGTYRTPNEDTMTAAQLGDYPTFCLDCHGPGKMPISSHGEINWGVDQHGTPSANQPNGYGTCPNWFACGQAFGWDGDDCTGSESDCWPVLPRGAGDQLFSRAPYTHTERVSGANFVLSCSDCHTTHEGGGPGNGKLRPKVNGAPSSQTWNTECNACHYYYSDWHAGMACGNASCHVSSRMSSQDVGNTPHSMNSGSGSSGTRTFNPDRVLAMNFEGNLKDSGGWELDGQWFNGAAGSFSAGKSGQAIVLNGDQSVQLGTENSNWSTDEGYHGTWKYTEMKYNTTFEAWVYPTSDTADDYTVFSKHVGYTDGGYGFALRKIDGTLRAAVNINVDGSGGGVRGAYSATPVPLNMWTHVAATFDKNGPDGDPGNPAAGRLRVYVNGEDVTSGSATGAYSQPGAGETNIYPYSQNSQDNPSVCYNGSWCASEFSIGGFDWQNGFVGGIDSAKVWNVTKNAAYFDSTDAATQPRIGLVYGTVGSDKLSVRMSEGVCTNSGQSGALVPGDVVFVDLDNLRTISAVDHVAGEATATLTLSSALDDTNDIGTDRLRAVANAVYDDHNNAAPTDTVTVIASPTCPDGQVVFDLNEATGTAYVLDGSGLLSGKVNTTTTPQAIGGGTFNGNGVDNYVDFESNSKCLQADTSMTVETRIYPTDTSGTANYIRRILARDGGGNWQISVWRNNAWGKFGAPSDRVATALWVSPTDTHGGNAWKPVLTETSSSAANYTSITGYRWYRIKAVWNSDKSGGTPDQPFVPCDIYVDDQGPNGDNVGQLWSGWRNATDADQSQFADDNLTKLYTGDAIKKSDGSFTIGANVGNHANNVFLGKIDYIKWQGEVDEYLDALAMMPTPPSGIGYLAFLADHPDWMARENPDDDASTRAGALALAVGSVGFGLLVIRRARGLRVTR
ncbi:MAG: hypothetical protein C4521_12445 [Actinobacteria bacterium]|nr:MAG: hypothetical protein C4521_12445 [Actinomycetota bacterium]